MNIEIVQTGNPKHFRLGDCKAGTLVKVFGSYCIVTTQATDPFVTIVSLHSGAIFHYNYDDEVEILKPDDYLLRIYEEE